MKPAISRGRKRHVRVFFPPPPIPSLFIHNHKFLLTGHKHSIYLVHKRQNQVPQTHLWFDDRRGEFCLSQHLIRLTSFAAVPVRWNNTTVMLFCPQSELLGNVTWMQPSFQERGGAGGHQCSACKFTLSPDHLKILQVLSMLQLAATSYFTFLLQLSP